MSTRRSDLRRSPFRGAGVVVPALLGGLFTWLTFFILGVRARRRDWIFVGGAYGVFAALAFFAVNRPEVERSDAADGWIGAGLIVAWFGGLIHAAITYRIDAGLDRPRVVPGAPPAPRPPGRRRPDRTGPDWDDAGFGDDAGLGFGNPAADYLASSRPVADPPSGGPPLAEPVQANTARARRLARLPGVTPELARRWVDERRRRGGFRDMDDLATALDLQPHQIVRLQPHLSFSEPGPRPPRHRRPGRRQGRVLDV